jgi:GNAT superfamily N-acetyltransferase
LSTCWTTRRRLAPVCALSFGARAYGRDSIVLSPPVHLTAELDFSAFDCGEPALNDWLKHRALKNESRFSRTYAICDERLVVGYFSISAGSVDRADVPGRLRRNAPDAIPVAIIGRLAVHADHSGRGLGASMLGDALARIASASRNIGIAAVLVHAKTDRARAFYRSCAEFIEYPADSKILFLPMETLTAAYG